ncbi:response regulator transcription factor [Accumulibacter sp.]|uniref:response regulator transcription factor n=1 Tax=Accumulibacter sp. TaxID=2053492 RepID=UPI0028C3D6BD|nr:response regulator transcription factor [Accumulibacter sp.]
MSETAADSGRIRVLVVDDQALIRRGMTLMLSLEADIEVVGQASDGVEAVALAERLTPDVVLMDLHMPRKGGVAATREITMALPHTHVLVLTTLDDEESVFAAVRAGAQAYLLKDASEDELLETVRAVHRGESRLTPQIARKVMDQFRRLLAPAAEPPVDHPTASSPPAATTRTETALSGPEALSSKEEKILALIAEGKSNKQIAAAVFLAEGTVKNYVSRIMEKLHANTRTELAIISLRQQPRA